MNAMNLKELKQLVDTNEEFSIPTAAEEREWVRSGEISKLVNHSYHRIVKILNDNEYDKWREEDIISDLIILLYEYAEKYSGNAQCYKSWIESKLIGNYKLKAVTEENLNAYKETLVDEKYEEMLDNSVVRVTLEGYIKKANLVEREKAVLYHRFYDNYTFEEVGEIIGVTRERIRQIEAKALRKIRYKTKPYIYAEEARIRKILEARQNYEYEYSKIIEKIQHRNFIEFDLRAAISSAELEFEGEYQIWNHEVLCRHINSIFRKLFIDFEGIIFNPTPRKEINPGCIILVFNMNNNIRKLNGKNIYQAVYGGSRTQDSYLILDHFKMDDYDQYSRTFREVFTEYFAIGNISLEKILKAIYDRDDIEYTITEELIDDKQEYTIKIYKVKKG